LSAKHFPDIFYKSSNLIFNSLPKIISERKILGHEKPNDDRFDCLEYFLKQKETNDIKKNKKKKKKN
jgi:hypothetical protein